MGLELSRAEQETEGSGFCDFHVPLAPPSTQSGAGTSQPSLNYRTSPTVLKRTPAKVGSSFRILRYCSLAWAVET